MSLHELMERVKAESGPDRELDARLWCFAEGAKFSHLARHDAAMIYFIEGKPGSCRETGWPTYTASIDAAVALIERVLPGCEWDVSTASGGRAGYEVEIVRPHGGAWTRPGPTPALALVAALLEAKIAEEKP
jgi:hypothetical protein